MTMTNKDIDKNLRLASDFSMFVATHPYALRIPKRVGGIVMGSASDRDITKKNLELAYEGMKRRRKPYFQAIKYARTWKLVAVKRPKAK